MLNPQDTDTTLTLVITETYNYVQCIHFLSTFSYCDSNKHTHASEHIHIWKTDMDSSM